MRTSHLMTALLLTSACGLAVAQPLTITGTKKPQYGNPRWVNLNPTSFGNNTVIACNPNTLDGALPQNVNTGVEIAIPLSALGSPTGTIRLAGYINGGSGSFLSNQIIGGLNGGPGQTASAGNLGEPRAVNFATGATATGNQFVNVNLAAAGTAPVIDGTRDASGWTLLFTQNTRTQFGDSTSGLVDGANGSEIDAVYYRVAGGNLYLFVAGNLEANGNRLDLFFDTGNPLGQNKLRNDNPVVAGGGDVLNRQGDDGSGNGLTFDAGFNASYYVSINGTGAPYQLFVDYAQLSNNDGSGGGVAFYAGSTTAVSDGTLTGGEVGAPAILATINNSNTAGVPATCGAPAGNPNVANGSEMGALYSYLDKTNLKLYVLLTGNLQTNFNSMNLFIDVGGFQTPGGTELGQNRLRNNNPDVDFNGPNNMGGPGTGPNPGLRFDAAFSPTWYLSYKSGDTDNFAHSLLLRTNGPATLCDARIDYGAFDGGRKVPPAGGNGELYDVIKFNGLNGFPGGTVEPFIGIQEQDGTRSNIYSNFAPYASHVFMKNYIGEPCNNVLGNPAEPKPVSNIVQVRFDNSNLAGVNGQGGAAVTEDDVIAVQTGLEFAVDLKELGYNGTNDIKLSGFIADGSRGFTSNQVIGGLPASFDAPGQHVGTTNQADFTTIAGDQFIVVFNSCPSDLSGDNQVDNTDFVEFAQQYNDFIAAGRWAGADLDGDGFVDNTDFVLFASAYNDFLCPEYIP